MAHADVDMTAHELTDEDRALVRWFAEERLGWKRDIEWERIGDGACYYRGKRAMVYGPDDLLGWPGFGRADAEIDGAGLYWQLIADQVEVWGTFGRLSAVAWDRERPAQCLMAALRDALG